jgi:hypothetical protein
MQIGTTILHVLINPKSEARNPNLNDAARGEFVGGNSCESNLIKVNQAWILVGMGDDPLTSHVRLRAADGLDAQPFRMRCGTPNLGIASRVGGGCLRKLPFLEIFVCCGSETRGPGRIRINQSASARARGESD